MIHFKGAIEVTLKRRMTLPCSHLGYCSVQRTTGTNHLWLVALVALVVYTCIQPFPLFLFSSSQVPQPMRWHYPRLACISPPLSNLSGTVQNCLLVILLSLELTEKIN